MAFVRSATGSFNVELVENATNEVLCGWNTLTEAPIDAYARRMADAVISSSSTDDNGARVLMLGLGCGAIAGAILCRM